MTTENNPRPLPVTSHWAGYSAWLSSLQFDKTLATPVRFLWTDYQKLCKEEGFDVAPLDRFIRWLNATDGVDIKEGGKGRIRRLAVGVAPEKTNSSGG